MRRSKELLRHRDAVLRFRAAFSEMMEVLEPRPDAHVGEFLEWVPKQGRIKRAAMLRQRVNEAAGPAAQAAATTGALCVVRPPGFLGWPARKVNAISSWTGALKLPNLPSVEGVLDYADQVAAVLTEQAEAAAVQERTLAGRLGRFLAFPYAVQDAARSQHPGFPRKVAFGAGVAAQIVVGLVVTIVGGLAVVWLAARLGLGPGQ
jgi:hypothetical protein